MLSCNVISIRYYVCLMSNGKGMMKLKSKYCQVKDKYCIKHCIDFFVLSSDLISPLLFCLCISVFFLCYDMRWCVVWCVVSGSATPANTEPNIQLTTLPTSHIPQPSQPDRVLSGSTTRQSASSSNTKILTKHVVLSAQASPLYRTIALKFH